MHRLNLESAGESDNILAIFIGEDMELPCIISQRYEDDSAGMNSDGCDAGNRYIFFVVRYI